MAIYLAPPDLVPASIDEPWTISLFLSQVLGTLAAFETVRLNLREYDAGGGGLDVRYGTDLRDTIDGYPGRFTTSATIAGTGATYVRPMLELTFGSGRVLNVTLRLAAPQLEAGAAASSPILTDGEAGNRGADRLTLRLPAGHGQLRLDFDDAGQSIIEGVGGDYDLDPDTLPGRWLRTASLF